MNFLITDYGAIGDSETINTDAINAAILAAHKAGGGAVVFPVGTFMTGTVHLKSNVTLQLNHGAVLLGSPNMEDYTKEKWGHHDDRFPYHLIYAHELEDIAITGDGTIDGNGHHFNTGKRDHEWAFFPEKKIRPTPMVEISRCQRVRVENIRLTRTSGWTLHLHDCDKAFIRGITIDNSLFWPNSDGIDLTGCHDTMISDCYIHTGDDAIALKTTDDSRSCEHITVTNCVLETSCAAIRLGFESDRDFINCTFSNITIKNCSRGIDLLTFAGGSILNCSFNNIVGRCMSGWCFDRPIAAYSGIEEKPYKCTFPEHPNFGKTYAGVKPGVIRGITITNFDMETCGRILLGCSEEDEIRDVSLNYVRLRYPMIEDPGISGREIKGKAFFPGQPDLRAARSALVAENVEDFRLNDFRVEWPKFPVEPQKVELLRSPNQSGNPYFEDLEKVISGEKSPPFHAVWLKNVSGHLDCPGLESSSSDTPAVYQENFEEFG
jgi:hypothetical protein